jgi:hypothetical protein
MARKSATLPKAAPAELSPAMDYAAHHATYAAFISMVKWSILALGVLTVALYFFIVGQQPLLGTVLLLAVPAIMAAKFVMRPLRA